MAPGPSGIVAGDCPHPELTARLQAIVSITDTLPASLPAYSVCVDGSSASPSGIPPGVITEGVAAQPVVTRALQTVASITEILPFAAYAAYSVRDHESTTKLASPAAAIVATS